MIRFRQFESEEDLRTKRLKEVPSGYYDKSEVHEVHHLGVKIGHVAKGGAGTGHLRHVTQGGGREAPTWTSYDADHKKIHKGHKDKYWAKLAVHEHHLKSKKVTEAAPGSRPWKNKKITAASLLRDAAAQYAQKNFGLLGALVAGKLRPEVKRKKP